MPGQQFNQLLVRLAIHGGRFEVGQPGAVILQHQTAGARLWFDFDLQQTRAGSKPAGLAGAAATKAPVLATLNTRPSRGVDERCQPHFIQRETFGLGMTHTAANVQAMRAHGAQGHGGVTGVQPARQQHRHG